MPHIKQLAKNTVEKILRKLVKIKLRRNRPIIVGVTGSFGKTSTKEAIYTVLKVKKNVYRNEKSFNTELGLLLAVLEQKSGFSSGIKWGGILFGAVINAFFGKKHEVLVLEYGADKPGDIEHLISIVKPDIAIITAIACVHQADGQFKNEEDVFNEKKKLVACLSKNSTAILNLSDPFLKKLDGMLEAKTLWFSPVEDRKSHIYADNLKNTLGGFSATIHPKIERDTYAHISAHFEILGAYHVSLMLPAILCGTLFDIPVADSIAALKTFKLPPGRMSLIEGKNGAQLIDSTYNASPQTVIQALDLLVELPAKRRIAVLGSMNELGNSSESTHREIGRYIATSLSGVANAGPDVTSGRPIDFLITVGEQASFIAKEVALRLKKCSGNNTIKALESPLEATKFLLALPLKEGDLILFKGSQNKVRLERAVKLLMKEPSQAAELLCRQEKEWQKIE